MLTSLRTLTAAIDPLTHRCVVGLEVDRERCEALVRGSIGLVTAPLPTLGYEASSHVARRALAETMTRPSRAKLASAAAHPT